MKSVCSDFAVALARNYKDIKRRGLNVRFVNVDSMIEPYVDVTNITMLKTFPTKPAISARELLDDLANNLSDRELMKKHGLSQRGLDRLFRKLLRKGRIFRRALARRMGAPTKQISVILETKDAKKVTVDAWEVMKNLLNEMTDAELMRRYKLSPRGLQSLFKKLYDKGFISQATFLKRRRSSGKISTSHH